MVSDSIVSMSGYWAVIYKGQGKRSKVDTGEKECVVREGFLFNKLNNRT